MMNESELLRRTRSGDEAAFGELYARHSPAVFRYALRMSGSDSAAEEVVQEVFLQVVRGCRGFDASIGSLASYLYGVARHTVARLGPDRGEIPIGEMEFAEDEPDPLEGLDRAQRVEAVRAAVASLPLAFREAVVLCDLEQMSYVSAAETLGLEIGTLRSRLHRARKMLLEKLVRTGVRA
jgi:RNA polymerase sigma-70 factor (ECF subfamily)